MRSLFLSLSDDVPMTQISTIERVMYAPRPLADYCPDPAPESCMLWHAVREKPDEDVRAACWNLIWLASPAIDRALQLDRRPGSHWQTVVPDVGLSVLVPIWPELHHAVLCRPEVFKAWLQQESRSILTLVAETLIDTVHRRLDETIARMGGIASARGHARRVSGNVTFVDFRAVRALNGVTTP